MTILVTEGAVKHTLPPIGTASCVDMRIMGVITPMVLSLEAWATFPSPVLTPVPALTDLMSELIRVTGWSHRRVAHVLRTSHPTIGAIARGETAADRRPDLQAALERTADVVSRVSALVSHDRTILNRVLQTRQDDGRTPLDLLAGGQYGQAYLRALDAVGRRHRPGVPLAPGHVRRPSMDVVALSDDDR